MDERKRLALSRANALRKEIEGNQQNSIHIVNNDSKYQEQVKQLKQQDNGILVVPLIEVKGSNNEPPSRHISKLKKPSVYSREQTHGPEPSSSSSSSSSSSLIKQNNVIMKHKEDKVTVFNGRNERPSLSSKMSNLTINGRDESKYTDNDTTNSDSILSTYHNHHSFDTSSNRFTTPPNDSAGNRYDISDRPIMCSSSDKRNEVIFGSSDHSLYSIDVNNPGKRPIQMYNKRQGHSDWVTSVAHLADGRVLSAGMDGKICLWDQSRRNSTELVSHGLSISKIVADQNFNVAISCGYDKNVTLWTLRDNGKSRVSSTSRAIVRAGSNSNQASSSASTILTGHADAVLECAFHKNSLASGSRDGGLILWDMATTSSTHRIRAHHGPITCIEAFQESSIPLFLTTGEDGYVKLWDPRGSTATDGLTNKIPAHIKADKKNPNMMKGAAISCLGKLSGRGSGLSYIVTGGADNSIVLMDARKSFEIIERWEHAKNCIYSLCVVGESIFVGDGAGMLLCYDVLSSNALKFGLGSSEMGGVRTINCTANGKIITGNEDGKGIVYSF